MLTVEDARRRVKCSLVNALQLEMSADDIPDSMRLFAPAEKGGLELDSLMALELIVALCTEFDLEVTEVDPAVFMSVDTLAQFALSQVLTKEGLGEAGMASTA